MKIQAVVKDLIDSGLSQKKIAQALGDQGVECSQPKIHRALHGSDPGYAAGAALVALHKQKIQSIETA